MSKADALRAMREARFARYAEQKKAEAKTAKPARPAKVAEAAPRVSVETDVSVDAEAGAEAAGKGRRAAPAKKAASRARAKPAVPVDVEAEAGEDASVGASSVDASVDSSVTVSGDAPVALVSVDDADTTAVATVGLAARDDAAGTIPDDGGAEAGPPVADDEPQATQAAAPVESAAPAEAPIAKVIDLRSGPATAPVTGPTEAEMDAADAAEEELGEACGHRSMNGRVCTRPKGHPQKSHRYN